MANLVMPFEFLYVLFGAVAIMIVEGLIFFLYWWDMKKFAPEAPIFKTARKKGLPMMWVTAMNDYELPFLVEKDAKGQPVIKFDKNSAEGIKIDPKILSGETPKSITTGGLQMYHYGTNISLPLSPKNVLAMMHSIEVVRDRFPALSSIPDFRLIELLGTDRADLPWDVSNAIDEFKLLDESQLNLSDADQKTLEEMLRKKFQEDNSRPPTEEEFRVLRDETVADLLKEERVKDVLKMVKEAQDILAVEPVRRSRFFTFAWAFRNISTAFMASDTRAMMQMFEQIANLKAQMLNPKVLIYAIALVAIFIGGALGYAIITNV